MSRIVSADLPKRGSPPVRPGTARRPVRLTLGLLVAFGGWTGLDQAPQAQAQAQAQPPAPDQVITDSLERTGPPVPQRPRVSPEELQERVHAAGAMLAEQGYRVRRDTWHGSLDSDARVRIPVFLFEGNDYRFIIATDGPLREVLMSIVDRDGALQPHRTEFGGPPSTRAISFAAQKTGVHYVQLGIIAEGGTHASCLGFTYR